MDEPFVRVERVDPYRVDVVLDRPAKLNALTSDSLEQLIDATRALRREAPRVVVLRSSIDRAFCVGADLTEQASLSAVQAYALSELGAMAFRAVAELPCPVIGRLAGHCLGGGLELALACDLRVGALDVNLAFPETGLGNSPAWGGMDRLAALVGRSRALDLLLTGRPVDAQQALEWGLLDRRAGHPDGHGAETSLDAAVDALAECIAGKAPIAHTAVKRRVAAAYPDHDRFLDAPHAAFQSRTDDAAIGRSSFATRGQQRTFGGS